MIARSAKNTRSGHIKPGDRVQIWDGTAASWGQEIYTVATLITQGQNGTLARFEECDGPTTIRPTLVSYLRKVTK